MSLNFLGIWCVIQLYMKDETPAMGLLEQELEELKKKARPAFEGFTMSSVPVKSNKGSVMGVGFFFLLLVLVVAGFFVLKNVSLPQKISLSGVNNKQETEATVTPTASASPAVNNAGSEDYRSTEGGFSLTYKNVFIKSDYIETVNSGVKLVYAPAKGGLTEVDDNGLEVKVIYIKGVKNAQNYAGVMRGKALYQPDKRNVVSVVDSYVNSNKITGYFYTVTGFGVAEDWYFDVDGGLARLEAYYNGTDEQIAEYAKMFREIVDSSKIL